MRLGFYAVASAVLSLAAAAQAADIRVSTSRELLDAIGAAEPGSTIVLAPGDYQGDMVLSDLHGAEGAPITLAGEDATDPPHIIGGGSSFHLVDCTYITLRDIEMSGQTGNGLNVDDGGSFDTPAHHIVLSGLSVRDVGPEGNRDGIKLSGVDDFLVERCTVKRWGSGGSAIDMVGCHRGVIVGCAFRDADLEGASGVQTKGGSADIEIRSCAFVDAGSRAINIGGSTGMDYFRPRPEGFEARNILVEGNAFVGGLAPLAFVGVDGAVVRYNTIYNPERWAIRILQETTAPGFVPCRNGVVEHNIFVFRSDRWVTDGVNIGPDTAPETFAFTGNLWYCEDQPNRSQPSLPTAEEDGLVGVDPLFTNTDALDFTLRAGSPAADAGFTALPAAGD